MVLNIVVVERLNVFALAILCLLCELRDLELVADHLVFVLFFTTLTWLLIVITTITTSASTTTM